MSDNYNEKQSILDKEEVQRIIDERIARLVEEEKQLDSPSTDDTSLLRKFGLYERIRKQIKKIKRIYRIKLY